MLTTGTSRALESPHSVVAVSTRARVGGIRQLWPAVRTTMRIREELERTPACLRFATVLAGSRELLTVSVWTDHDAVLEFLGDGAHGPVLWRRPGWLASYWGMRWRPGPAEVGQWDGASVGVGPRDADRRAGAERPPPGFASSPLAASLTSDLAGTLGTTYRLDAGPGRLLAALGEVHRLRRRLQLDPDVFSCAGGLASGNQVLLLVIWRRAAGARRFANSSDHHGLLRRWAGRVWWMEWRPEAETGQWDGRRLREERLGRLAGRPALLDVRLAPTFDAPGQAREAFDGLGLDLPDHVGADARALLSELVTNSVRHALLAEHEWIRVRVQAERGSIRVEVADPGPGFDAPSGEPDADGLGLSLMRQLPARWGILTDGPTRVLFELDS